ncbi:hypothetical protein SANBI_002327 [Sanguibacter sp. 4.1]|uniref:Uncharacterized protein n=1 Tax=Sanguibacter biliveldensis TaxID=3030830 RepID=A0AAF1C1V6_9MICO|nr:hypothetical protein [Sanguibacter sp. 4.1]WPF81064.1 hypothetical protein SANBI_002327 [Sanguibacter sp. 4.1]
MSTIFPVAGMTTHRDVLRVRTAMYAVPGVGGFSAELSGTGARIILKHTDDVVLDADVVDRALRTAGRYSVAAPA